MYEISTSKLLRVCTLIQSSFHAQKIIWDIMLHTILKLINLEIKSFCVDVICHSEFLE